MLLALLLGAPAMAVESRVMALEAFDAVHLSGGGTLRLTQGASFGLSAQGPAQGLAALRVERRGGTLFIGTPSSARNLEIDLQVESLRALVNEGNGRISGAGLRVASLRLEGRGAGSFHLEGLEADELTVSSHGATRFDLTGLVGRQLVELSGSGAYRAEQLISNHTTVRVTGTSDVRLWADELLRVSVAGAAAVQYLGSARVEQQVSGMASVLRIPQLAI